MRSLPLVKLLEMRARPEAVPPLLLITGDSGLLAERAVQAVAELVPEAERPLCLWRGSALEADPDRLLEEASTLPMWGARRVLIVRQAEKFPLAKHAGWERYLERPAASSVVAFVASPGADARMLRALASACAVVDCRTPSARSAPGWIVAEARALECTLEPTTATWMVEVVGRDLAALAAWLERGLLLRGQAGRLRREDLEQVCGRRSPANLFAWADRIGEGRLGEALVLAHRALEDGEEPLPLLGRATNHLRRLARLKQATATGAKPAEAAEYAGVRSFLAEAMVKQSRARTERELARALSGCAAADRALKSSRASSARVLDRWLFDIHPGGRR